MDTVERVKGVEGPRPQLLRVSAWKAYPWLLHGFSTRRDGLSRVYLADGADQTALGELNLGFTSDDEATAVAGNRAALAQAVADGAGGPMPLVLVRQVHGTVVRVVRAGEMAGLMAEGRAVTDGDGLVTAEAGVLLGVQAADCVPVLIADERLRVVAALHAGWRGTAAGIVAEGVAQMNALGSREQDLVAAVGPSIGPCCYAVGDEVQERFSERFADAGTLFEQRGGAMYLNLWESNRRQLVQAGVPAEQVTVVRECSACFTVAGRRRYFSHRADHGRSGRMMGVIGVAAE